jgi:hypothetical protein
MARGACTFRQRDLTAAVRAMEAAGKTVARVEIEPATGKMIVVAKDEPTNASGAANEWDAVR